MVTECANKPKIQYQVLIEDETGLGAPRPKAIAKKYGGKEIAWHHTHRNRVGDASNFEIWGDLVTFAFDGADAIGEFRQELVSRGYKIHEGDAIK